VIGPRDWSFVLLQLYRRRQSVD